MADAPSTGPDRTEYDDLLPLISVEAQAYLAALDRMPVVKPDAERAAERIGGDLPDTGVGASSALREVLDHRDGILASSGPRFYGWVTGGVTPAALGGDWLAALIDQNSADWIGAPLTTQLETVSIRWLLQLFGLPSTWGGVLTTGATMANFVGLAAARRWWALRHGVDPDVDGLSGLPAMPVLASGYVHPSDAKALAMLGLGRGRIRRYSSDAAGRLDVAALGRELKALGGDPAVVIASAGEVNAGDFDPVDAMADLAGEYGAWLHVDGAFGLFAGLSPRTEKLVEGIARADSVIADGHKWLNVPYESGFAFLKDPSLLPHVFGLTAAYLPPMEGEHPGYGHLGPEGSRRARSLAVWATLRAYGRSGYQEVVERCLDLAQRLASRVDASPELERLADVPLNIVCFRFRPPGIPDDQLDELNRRLGEAIIADGRVFFGTTVYERRVAFRPALVNWRTGPEDVDLIVDVALELGRELVANLEPAGDSKEG
jgi:glutamate/tyrosine decarboxylase-like PLP-dependent enzyme